MHIWSLSLCRRAFVLAIHCSYDTSEKYDCLRSTSTSFQRSHNTELPVDLVFFFGIKMPKEKKTNYRFHFAKSRIGFSVAAYEPHGARFMRRVASSSVPSFPYSFAAWLTLYFTISILVAVAGTFFFRALNRNENEPVFGCFFFGARKVHLRRFVTAPNELGS